MKRESIGYKFFKFCLFTFLMMVSAINYNVFINPTKTVAGGTNGVSIILEKLFDLNPSITIFVISMTILTISFVFEHYEKAVTALYAAIIYPFFVTITANASYLTEIRTVDVFIAVVFSGVIYGLIAGITTKLKMSQGGVVLISQIISDKFKVSFSKVNFTINLIIVLAGGSVFGVKSIIYALIFLTASKLVIEKITTGISKNKIFQIITSKEVEVKEYISNALGVGSTTFGAHGGYGKKKKTVIMTAVTNADYFRLKEGIHAIDKDAFIVITDSYQVQGGK